MQITCNKCGAGIKLPADTHTGDVVRCAGCGRKIRIKLRAAPREVHAPNEAVIVEPAPRRRNWILRLLALVVIGGVGFAIWQNWPLDFGAIKAEVERQVANTGLIPTDAILDQPAADVGDSNKLATQVAALFEDRCHRCHGAGGSDEGGFNFVIRLDKLDDENAYVAAGSPADSYLFERIEAHEMPPADSGATLSDEEIALVRQWIETGAPAAASAEPTLELVSSDDLLRFMQEDLQGLDPAVHKEMRYFTLTHLYNAGLSQDELETYRLALAKLVNSLTWVKDLVVPARVGDHETLLRINLSELGWNAATWDKIVATDPYAVTVSTQDGRAIRDLTGTNVPNVRADWFVSRASRAPLYYELLEIPKTLKELTQRVEIAADVEQNIANDRVVRAAFIESGVSDHNRMIERHAIASGGFWVSYDFASSVDKQNVLQHPLGPGGDDAFQHDGGEIIFSLPNGLQGYLLVNGTGDRIEKGPLTIVADDKQADRAVVAGLSCMSCHANGMIRKQDEVRPTVLANRDAFASADRILRQYPEAATLEQVLTADTTRFESALKNLGFGRLTDTSEPIFHMAKRFDQAVDRSLAAAEFGLSTDRFLQLLDSSPAVAQVLGVLKVPNGKVKRQQFLAAFKDAAQAFGLGIGFGDEPTSDATPVAAATAPATGATATPAVVSTAQPAATGTPATPPVVGTAATATAGAPANPATVAAGAPGPPDLVAAAPPTTPAIEPLPPEAFIHDWTKADGSPLLYARFFGVVPSGDVRVQLVPRQWTLTGEKSSSYDYPAFSGTFWAFLQKPGTPVLVRIGEISLPGAPLNYVDYPRESFCEEDQAYLKHLEQLIAYAYVSKGRVRYYTLPWDVISAVDQQYVYKLIAYVQSLQPPAGASPPAAAPVPGQAPPPIEAPPDELAGPPDLPSAGDAPVEATPEAPAAKPYGY